MALNEAEIVASLSIGSKKEPVSDAVVIAIQSSSEVAIREARESLLRQSFSKSGTLGQSIELMPMEQKEGSWFFEIGGEAALEFVDKGVNGTMIGRGSPYSFKYPRPSRKHVQAVKDWIRAAGISATGSKSFESLSWAIASASKKEGLKAKPFIQEFLVDRFSENLSRALELALGKSIELKFQTFEDRFKK